MHVYNIHICQDSFSSVNYMFELGAEGLDSVSIRLMCNVRQKNVLFISLNVSLSPPTPFIYLSELKLEAVTMTSSLF